jgi:hypothetical protein
MAKKAYFCLFLLLYKYSLVTDSFHGLGVLKANYHVVCSLIILCVNTQYLLLQYVLMPSSGIFWVYVVDYED